MLQWMQPVQQQWQFIELFSGAGNVSTAFRDHGFNVCSYDKVSGGKSMNFSSAAGFALGSKMHFEVASRT